MQEYKSIETMFRFRKMNVNRKDYIIKKLSLQKNLIYFYYLKKYVQIKILNK